MASQSPLPIRSYTEYEAALDRIAELAGCLEDTAEEREMIDLVVDVAIWETKAHHMKDVYLTDREGHAWETKTLRAPLAF